MRRQWLSIGRALATPLIVILLGLLFRQTAVARFVDINFVIPAYYQIRSAVGLDPVLDPRIKILAFDDNTVSRIKMLDLPLKTWGVLMRSLAERQPKQIMIDKIFDKPYEEAEIAAFAELMTSINLTTVGFVADREIPLRTTVKQVITVKDRLPDREERWFYGANPSIQPLVRIGHAVYDGEFRVNSVIPVSDHELVPHWAYFADSQLQENPEQFHSSISHMSSDNYEIWVNFINPQSYLDRVYSLWPALASIVRKQPQSLIQEGDVVLIIPAMYTGNTDFKRTPFGVVPGGHVMVSLLNSVMTGQWLREVPLPWVHIVLAAMVSMLVAAFIRSPAKMFLTYALLAALWIVVCLGLFAVLSYYMNWLHPLMTFSLCTFVTMAGKTRALQIDRVKLEKEIETAQVVQSALLQRGEANEGDHCRVIYRPAAVCSGDWWCRKRLDEQFDLLILIDATGHGISAALISAVAHAGFHGSLLNTPGPHTPAAILRNINRICCQQDQINMTAVVALINRSTGSFLVASAGHCQPFVISPGKRVKGVTVRGNILGIDPEEDFAEVTVEAPPGAILLLFSDGLIENRDKSDNIVNRRRLQKMLELEAPTLKDLDLILSNVVEKHRRDIEQDDVTVMLYEL